MSNHAPDDDQDEGERNQRREGNRKDGGKLLQYRNQERKHYGGQNDRRDDLCPGLHFLLTEARTAHWPR